jgi:hypothetical protein
MTEETTKLTHLKKYDVNLLMENTTEETVRNEQSELPTDVHVVTYKGEDGEQKVDAVRAYRMTDVFDGYYDRGITVLSISSGFGSVRPNLYGNKTKEKK